MSICERRDGRATKRALPHRQRTIAQSFLLSVRASRRTDGTAHTYVDRDLRLRWLAGDRGVLRECRRRARRGGAGLRAAAFDPLGAGGGSTLDGAVQPVHGALSSATRVASDPAVG